MIVQINSPHTPSSTMPTPITSYTREVSFKLLKLGLSALTWYPKSFLKDLKSSKLFGFLKTEIWLLVVFILFLIS